MVMNVTDCTNSVSDTFVMALIMYCSVVTTAIVVAFIALHRRHMDAIKYRALFTAQTCDEEMI